MSDLIERKDAIDYFVTNIGVVDEDGYAVDDYDERVKIWTERFSGIPSAEPEPKWIPVTEALPEEEKDVLVSVHFEGFKGKTVDLPPSDYVDIASHVEGVWSSLSDEYKAVEVNHHVIAWMEMPEPWRGE